MALPSSTSNRFWVPWLRGDRPRLASRRARLLREERGPVGGRGKGCGATDEARRGAHSHRLLPCGDRPLAAPWRGPRAAALTGSLVLVLRPRFQPTHRSGRITRWCGCSTRRSSDSAPPIGSSSASTPSCTCTCWRTSGAGRGLARASSGCPRLTTWKPCCSTASTVNHMPTTSPNRALQRAGFTYLNTHETRPSAINFWQPVTRWVWEPGEHG